MRETETLVFAKTKHLLCGFQMVAEIFRNKKVASVCMFLAHIGVFLSALDPGQSLVLQENRNDQSMDFTWRIGDFHAEKGKYT